MKPFTRRLLLHLALLAGVCALVYFPGLDAHGVTNWQEAQRLIVAREMQERWNATGDWRELVLPTANGEPYLAKPPLIYWLQIAAAGARGERVELWHLRLVVALAATLGVLATYLAGREVLRPDRATVGADGRFLDETWVENAALFGAMMTATAILIVRSGRIGELDILLVPACAGAIGFVARAWRSHRLQRATSIPAVAGAVACATLAVMTKEPGVLVIGLGAYGGMALWAALGRPGARFDVSLVRERGAGASAILGAPSPAAAAAPGIAGALCGLAVLVIAAARARNIEDAFGAVLLGCGAGFGAWVLARLAQPIRARAFIVALSRTHPVVVIGIAAGVRILWGWAAARMIPPGVGATLVNAEVEDNIRVLIPEAPVNYVETLVFGAGLGSVAAVLAAVMLIKERPRIPASWMQLIAWIVLVVIALSFVSKGVQRYLTPVWPAVGLFGGIFVATAWRDERIRRWFRPAFVVAVLALAGGQSWWYAAGRERHHAARSPRDLIGELAANPKVDIGRLVTIDFAHPAIDYYAGRRVQPVGDTGSSPSVSGRGAWTIDKLADVLEHKPAAFALIPLRDLDSSDQLYPVLRRLRNAGVHFKPIETEARFVIDGGRTEVHAYKLKLSPER